MFTELSVVPSLDSSLPCMDSGQEDATAHFRPTLKVCFPNDASRPELEKFVHTAFLRAHAAQVHSFTPLLLSLRNDEGTLLAVCGYRSAFDHLLHLEDYLDEPIEMTLSQRAGRPVKRRAIVEIGNFAALDAAHARQLMRLLPAYLMKLDYSWVTFTATRTIRNMLSELGASPLELCNARSERLLSRGSRWGNYFRADPRVMAGCLPTSLELKAFKPYPFHS